jgi:hypothetical protein
LVEGCLGSAVLPGRGTEVLKVEEKHLFVEIVPTRRQHVGVIAIGNLSPDQRAGLRSVSDLMGMLDRNHAIETTMG